MAENLESLLKRLKSGWNLLAAFAAWLVLVIGGFLLPPPVGAFQFGSGGRVPKLAGVVTAILVGLLAVPLIRWSAKRYIWRWWKAAAATLILSIITFFAYEWFASKWTCIYNNQRVVIGSVLTPHGKDFIDKNPSRINCEDWIMSHAGKVDEIWTRESIDVRCALLAFFYLITLPLFATAIICVLQAIHCSSRPK